MALKSLTSFTKDLDCEDCAVDFRLYDQQVLGHYNRLLNSSHCFIILEEVLGGLSLYATLISRAFSTYYNQFMPLLKEIVARVPSGANLPQQESVRVLATECMGYLLTAVKDQPELFQPDLVAVMSGLLSLHRSIKEEDDQNLSAIVNVYANLAAVMGPAFQPYLAEVFPLVLKAAAIDVSFTVEDVLTDKTAVQNSKFVAANIDLKLLGGKKRLALNAAAFELKIAGLQCLKNMVEHVETHLHQGDNIEMTMTLCLSLISDNTLSREIKQLAMEVVGGLVSCLPPANQGVLVAAAFPVVHSLLKKEIEYQREEEIVNVTECLCALLKDYKESSVPFPGEQAVAVVMTCSESLEYAQVQKKQLVKKCKVEDLGEEAMDDQENKEFQEEYEALNDVF